MSGLSIRGYARHRGVSHTAVRKALEDQRITKGADGKIDPALADRDWETRTDPGKPSNSVTGEPKHRRAPGAPSSPRWSDAPASPPGEPAAGRVAAGYAASEALRSQFKARREKLALDRETGKTVEAAEVRHGAFAAGKKYQGAMLAMPEQLSGEVAGKDREECYAILRAWAVRACEDLQVPASRSE
jgi:hypothetical protein